MDMWIIKYVLYLAQEHIKYKYVFEIGKKINSLYRASLLTFMTTLANTVKVLVFW